MRKISIRLAGSLVTGAVVVFGNMKETHAAMRGDDREQGRDGDVRERLASVHGLTVEVRGVPDKVSGDGVGAKIERE